jgi:hypothetical protein
MTQRYKIQGKLKDHCTAVAAKIGPSERERREKDNKSWQAARGDEACLP